jgi:hypothetical protein
MEDFTIPLSEQDNEIDDEEIIMPDRDDFMKNIVNPYAMEDGSCLSRNPRY